jgi:hypothetical protein
MAKYTRHTVHHVKDGRPEKNGFRNGHKSIAPMTMADFAKLVKTVSQGSDATQKKRRSNKGGSGAKKAEENKREDVPKEQRPVNVEHTEVIGTIDVEAGQGVILPFPLSVSKLNAPYLKNLSKSATHYRYLRAVMEVVPMTSALTSGSVIVSPYIDDIIPDTLDSVQIAGMLGSTGPKWLGGPNSVRCPFPTAKGYAKALNPDTEGYDLVVDSKGVIKHDLTAGYIVAVTSSVTVKAALAVKLHYTIALEGRNTSEPSISAETSTVIQGQVKNDLETFTALEGTFYGWWQFITKVIDTLQGITVDLEYKEEGIHFEYTLHPGYYELGTTVDDTDNGAQTNMLMHTRSQDASKFQVAWAMNGLDTMNPKNSLAKVYVYVKEKIKVGLAGGDYNLGDILNGVVKWTTIASEAWEFLLPFLSVIVDPAKECVRCPTTGIVILNRRRTTAQYRKTFTDMEYVHYRDIRLQDLRCEVEFVGETAYWGSGKKFSEGELDSFYIGMASGRDDVIQFTEKRSRAAAIYGYFLADVEWEGVLPVRLDMVRTNKARKGVPPPTRKS